MSSDGEMLGIGMFLGFLLTAVVFILLGGGTDKQELGQAICDKEYDMDYLGYSTKEGLECQAKAAIVEKKYDGIKVKLMEEENELKNR